MTLYPQYTHPDSAIDPYWPSELSDSKHSSKSDLGYEAPLATLCLIVTCGGSLWLHDSVCLAVWLSVRLSVRLSICLSGCLAGCLSGMLVGKLADSLVGWQVLRQVGTQTDRLALRPAGRRQVGKLSGRPALY